MRNIKTKNLATAMNNIVSRIRSDLVMSVCFAPTKEGGHYCIWLTEAGDKKIIWKVDFFPHKNNVVNLPVELTTEK